MAGAVLRQQAAVCHTAEAMRKDQVNWLCMGIVWWHSFCFKNECQAGCGKLTVVGPRAGSEPLCGPNSLKCDVQHWLQEV